MRKLNRKGFTLVELLAVIVILAIVVGITLVTVLPTLKQSRQRAFELTADTAADYVEKQYQLYVLGSDISGDVLEIAVGDFGIDSSHTMVDDDYKKAGLKADNYVREGSQAGTWSINSGTGRACVILYPSTEGEYYDATGPARSAGC